MPGTAHCLVYWQYNSIKVRQLRVADQNRTHQDNTQLKGNFAFYQPGLETSDLHLCFLKYITFTIMHTLIPTFTQHGQLPWREYRSLFLVSKCYYSQLWVTFVISHSAEMLGIPDLGEHVAGQHEEKIIASNITFLPFFLISIFFLLCFFHTNSCQFQNASCGF